MNIFNSIQGLLKKPSIAEKPVVEAYDIWSGTYDEQPGNLMLHLDELIFSSLLSKVQIGNKDVVDIGCGTGRHWKAIYQRSPASLVGYDVSAGMLNKLTQKFPQATVRHTINNLLEDIRPATVDCLVSTLTIAHIANLDEAIAAWVRVLKPGRDLIVTDFHPAILAHGGKRSFKDGTRNLSVKNYVHPVPSVKEHFKRHGLKVMMQEERVINASVKHFYEAQGALNVFEKFRGMPVIYGLYLKK